MGNNQELNIEFRILCLNTMASGNSGQNFIPLDIPNSFPTYAQAITWLQIKGIIDKEYIIIEVFKKNKIEQS